MTAPIILIEDPGELAWLRDRLARDGWHPQDGWELPIGGDWDLTAARVLCVGAIQSGEDGETALLAGARGAGLVIVVTPQLSPELLEDLHRLGPVQRRAARTGDGELDAQTTDLLRALSDGRSIADAATECLMSLRTAHRRLDRAKQALGVGSRAELLVEFARRHDG